MLNRLFQKRDAVPQLPIVPWRQDYVSLSGPVVNETTALGITGVWRAVNMIANLIASLPLEAFEANAPLTPAPMLLEQPCPQEDRMDTIFQMVVSLLFHGNAYALLGGWDDNGYPTMIVPMHPQNVQVQQLHGQVVYTINARDYDPSQVMHIRGFILPGYKLGLGVIQAQMAALGHNVALGQYAQRWFAESAIPPGVITYPDEMTKEEADAIKSQWMAAHAGNRTPAVLSGGASFTEYGLTPEASQFIQSREFSLTEIANMFGLPPNFLGAPGPRMTYTNSEEESLNLLKYGLRPWIVRIERAFSALLPPTQYARFDVDDILRTDKATRYATYTTGLAGGWLTIEDIQKEEDEYDND